MPKPSVFSGIPALDKILHNIRLGDNVVWQVDSLDDYAYFTAPLARTAIAEGRNCIYLRFAPHPPVLQPQPGLKIVELDPSPGFDYFSSQVYRLIDLYGRETFYILDNLSALATEWATDEMLANFFRLTCPYLFELDTVAYFALSRGKHANSAIAAIRDTTQLLLDIYHAGDRMYIHPLKVWDRYSTSMFLPHVIGDDNWLPVSHSGEAAAAASTACRQPIPPTVSAIAPWDSVYARLLPYRSTPAESLALDPELTMLKQEFRRMLLGNPPSVGELADRYLDIDSLCNIRERLIGSGRIGGKAAGMLLARCILLQSSDTDMDFRRILEEHDSFYIGSDVFYTFLVNNDLFRLRLQIKHGAQLSHSEFADVEARFLKGSFSASITEQFRNLLDYFGQAPIIVRSSSLLEDGFGNAFAGKYRSVFCANQGSPETRLEAFLEAVKLVYASVLNPDALSYRQKRGLGANDEQMAILVQRVSGMPYGDYFFPGLSGVAFSRNLYAWSDRIDPKKGIIRLVSGLGTRAVDRVGGDYPRMISISHPELRPESANQVARYSQYLIDLLDLNANELDTLPISRVFAGMDYPHLPLLVSTTANGYLSDPISNHIDGEPQHLVLTFNNLIRRTKFVKVMEKMLSELEKAYEHPVDTEFTASVDGNGDIKINLLQCRPLFLPGTSGPVDFPEQLEQEKVLFRSGRMISGGVVADIRYILFIDPRLYSRAPSAEIKMGLGRLVGRINRHPDLAGEKLVMMGPGRWGSSNIDLGINAGYYDIDNASVLVEIAREEDGHRPEVSYGTHFFQDLVEGQVICLPVYPDDQESSFNEEFFAGAPNTLTDLLPEAARYASILKLIDVPAACKGCYGQLIADPNKQRAVCFLGPERAICETERKAPPQSPAACPEY